MPAKGGYPLTAKTPGIHIVAGSFTTAGASAPSVVLGAGFTVSAPTAGKYTVTLTDGPFAQLIGRSVDIHDGGANSTVTAHTGSFTTSAVEIFTQSAPGTDANLTGPVVSFIFLMRNTGASK
jgi:hypothetical protein